jgi:hypothetical protein
MKLHGIPDKRQLTWQFLSTLQHLRILPGQFFALFSEALMPAGDVGLSLLQAIFHVNGHRRSVEPIGLFLTAMAGGRTCRPIGVDFNGYCMRRSGESSF